MAFANQDDYGARVFWSYLMLFFFGVFGVHRFYLGHTLTGFIWLFSGGLCGIGVLLDIFLIPALAANVN
mgnify:CR=1 FL=1|jgi:TM2 domain-containing membrane protein YozV